MSQAYGAWGVPDFGVLIDRERILKHVSAHGARPCALWGPSGCGKSVAAAQLGSQPGTHALWIHAGGQPTTVAQLADAIMRALGEPPASRGRQLPDDTRLIDVLDVVGARCLDVAAGRGARPTVVLDDVGAVAAGAEADRLRHLARGLWHRGVQLVVTTRELESWPPDVICDFEVLGPEDLALSEAECAELLRCMRLDDLIENCRVLRDACGGHAAFFRVLAAQAKSYGLQETVTRTAPLDAWLRRVFSTQLSGEDRRILVVASLLGAGTADDLDDMGTTDAANAIWRIAAALPLVACGQTQAGATWFRVHDLVVGFCSQLGDESVDSAMIRSSLALLTERRNFSKAANVLRLSPESSVAVDWLEAHGNTALEDGQSAALQRVLGDIPTSTLLGHPRLLLLSAEVCREYGRFDDALARARAATDLAEHAGDLHTADEGLAQSLRLTAAFSVEEACNLARQILRDRPNAHGVLRAEALVTVGHASMCRGDYAAAEESLAAAAAEAHACAGGEGLAAFAEQGLALLPGVAFGDFGATIRRLQPLIDQRGGRLSHRVAVRGNMAVILVETGRLDRCDSLMRVTLRDAEMNGLQGYLGAFLAGRACSELGRGTVAEAISDFRCAIANSLEAKQESEADQSRVYLATALRSGGEAELSLVEAERAYDRLTRNDLMDFRRLAALEVAASLLALGDPSAARNWAETVVDEGFNGNLYHALRADMILAEVDRREGRVCDAVTRLAAAGDHIMSESSNWQVAMYCRAFPELLGLFALAVGADKLPVHMLRMILPEHAERSLVSSRSFLDETTWRVLGQRLLGDEELSKLVARKGLPLCHVRVFGGLEVSVGGRTVRERDWKKRKARLLFAMLVTHRGRDVPRDQVFEYLWPELDEERAKNNLYVAWSTMKSVLLGPGAKGSCPYVESVGGVCRTIRDTVCADIDDFEKALVRAREAESTGDMRGALSAYERIGDLYRGDLLPGDCYDDWFSTLRDHYRTEFVDAMLRATQLLNEADDPGNALTFVRRAIQTDPFREDLYQCALRCQIAAGQRSSAIDTYFQLRAKLADELGLDPSAETKALYDQILAMEDRPRPTPIDPMFD